MEDSTTDGLTVENQPLVFVIPVYNDEKGISETIDSLLSLSTSQPFKLIVVDNDSTDNTRGTIQDYANRYKNISFLVEDEIQGSYAARNKGVQAVTDGILVFIDADETVDEDYLENALKTMKKQNVDYLGCNVKLTLPEDTLVGRYNAHTGFPVKQYLEEQHYAPTCALLVRREVFEDVGSFDSRLISGGDREFGERVDEVGYKQGYAENAVVYHPARTEFRSLAKKNIRVGRGFCQKQRYYPERYGTPGIPPRPDGPSGNNGTEPDTLTVRAAFTILSIMMLACRGFGYYKEFFFGKKRDDIPAPMN